MTPQERWLEYLRVERGRSTNTITTYARTLRTLPADPISMTRAEIEDWWRSRARDTDGNERPHSSRNNELSAVRMFFKWCVRYELRDDDPTSRIDQLREQKRESRFIGHQDLEHLLGHLAPDMRRALALGVYAGMRVSEVARLNWDDINMDLRRISVTGKGDKQRLVGLSTRLLDILLPVVPGGNVVTAGKEEYTGHYLSIKVNKAMQRNGLSRGLTFHSARHRYGYMAAASGVPITSIARSMGHESISVTQRYIAAVSSDLDLIAEAVAR